MYHHFQLCRVRPSDRIKMSISKVTSEQYERLNSDLTEIRRAGTHTILHTNDIQCCKVALTCVLASWHLFDKEEVCRIKLL